MGCFQALHALGSDQLGNEPFEGTFLVTVKDGLITRAEERFPFADNGFSEEMWEPMQRWVYRTHRRTSD